MLRDQAGQSLPMDQTVCGVEAKDGRIILTPVRLQKADAVREKLAAMGIGEEDVADAVRWARQRD